MKRFIVALGLVLVALLSIRSSPIEAQSSRVVRLPGSIQAALGGKAWDPAGDVTKMLETAPDHYEFVAAFPKGNYEYKVAVNGTWDENYGQKGASGGANIGLVVTADNKIVKFVFEYSKKTIMDSVNNPDLVTAPDTVPTRATTPVAAAQPAPSEGSTRMVVHYKRARADFDGWNIWAWASKPAGTDGKAYDFTSSDDFGKTATIDIPGKHTEFGFIVRKGNWEAKDFETDRFVTVPASGISEIWVFQGRKEFETSRAAADAYLAKAAPPRGEPAFLDSSDTIRAWLPQASDLKSLEGKVKLTINGKDLGITKLEVGGAPVAVSTDSVDPKKVVLPGTIQSALGGTDWNPNGDITRMQEISSGVFEFVAAFPKGDFEYKIAKGGSWTENYGADFAAGGSNIALSIPKDGTIVKFVVNFNTKTVHDSINNPKEVQAPATVPTREKPVVVATTGPVQVLAIKLEKPLGIDDLGKFIELKISDDFARTVYARDVLDDKQYQYSGEDLGSRYSKTATSFKVWSPISSSAELFIFDDASSGPDQIIDMKRDQHGVWSANVKGDLHGHYYQYRFKSYNETRVTADINCFAASVDGKRSMVVDLSKTNPKEFSRPKGSSRPMTESVLYEMHIRDFTIDPSSGVKPELRGKYLGLAQTGTTVPGSSQKTGLNYLRDLGVTDIHLMPFQKINPANNGGYNWGYETNLFNVPEGQYSTTPNQPANTITEVKTMIAALHKAGLRAVMDVVYNHSMPASGEDSAFWQTVPYYYFRTNDQGQVLNESGVGNALHDERPMVRKYIRDSLKYWVLEYGIDGFRFDLIGMFSKSTVQNLTLELHKIRPDLVLYGEPWTGGGPLRFGKGSQRGLNFAVFNDNYRNAMRGDLDGNKPGFINGALTSITSLKRGIVGSIAYDTSIQDFTDQPIESINYVSAHDNLALWDKLEKVMPDANMRLKSANLAAAMVLLAQGVPFLEGGVEIGRSKAGNNNSYNAGDAVNKYDWTRASSFTNSYNYMKGLIALRRAFPAFRLSSADAVKKTLKFLPDSSLPLSTIAFTLEGAKRILVVFHGSTQSDNMQLPAGTWTLHADGTRAGLTPLGTISGNLKLEPLSSYVLVQ